MLNTLSHIDTVRKLSDKEIIERLKDSNEVCITQ